ncbi:MAG: hypothetical protein ACFCGT_22700 [Sandaracinaceae bacterium]
MRYGTLTMASGLALLLFAGCDNSSSGDDMGPGLVDIGPVGGAGVDSDSDFISDSVEGFPDRDSDGDNQPDYLDTDSDGDSILDRIEAGDESLTTPPFDSDDDGVPDYLDDDSDGNRLLDRIEGEGDTDGNGIRDYADPDDDGDNILDIIEIGGGDFPRDTDADTVPDFRDIDSDGDFILDRTERGGEAEGRDSDQDGTLDYLDLDSDNDGLTDAEEAGDTDLSTSPVDTDGDEVPDYLDLDSDADGLRDSLELEINCSPINPDSDGDGSPDLIEVGAGTDCANAADNPRVRGDFVFIVPFREAADPPRDTLRFRTNIRRLDAYFNFDITGSMIGEINTMRSRVVEIIDRLSCSSSMAACTGDLGCSEGEICNFEGLCIEDPETSGCIPDLWTGVGTYAGGGNTYRNFLSLQPDPTVTQDAIPSAAEGPGFQESLFETAACIADPTVCFGALCGDSGIGCPSFRRDAVRVLVFITDETNQCVGPDENPGDAPCPIVNTAGAAGGRLALQKIRFIAVDADANNSPRQDLRAVGIASDTTDSTGDPFYYEGNEAAVADAVVTGIGDLAQELQFFVAIEAQDLTGDDGDAVQFIQRLEVNTETFGCSDPGRYADTNGDGFDDAFSALEVGTPVCWDVVVRPNARVRPLRDRPQVFEAQLTVFGDGSPLDQRRVFFLVPPEDCDTGPDSGGAGCREE